MSLLDHYLPLDGVRLNMIVGSSGQFIDETGSSRGLGNELDRSLISHLRKISDVVVTGGETARVEKYSVPKNADLAIISRKPWPEQERQLVISADLEHVFAKGYSRILMETGPSLSRFFLESDLVDEFCLTVAGGSVDTATSTVAGLGSKMVLADQILDGSTLFTIWRRGNE
jgi:riboflavin biosynthesis pyrimidine reductase